MNEQSKDAGIIAALVERAEKQRIPRANALKEKVDRGELLDDFDVVFMDDVFHSLSEHKVLVDRHPECQELFARAVSLYASIMAKASENETAGSAK